MSHYRQSYRAIGYAIEHERARVRQRLSYLPTRQALPSDDFSHRLTKAIEGWEDSDRTVPRGASQSELSRRLRKRFGEKQGPSQPTIWGWVHGKAAPRINHVAMLAMELGVGPSWLAFGDATRAALSGEPRVLAVQEVVETVGQSVPVPAPEKRKKGARASGSRPRRAG